MFFCADVPSPSPKWHWSLHKSDQKPTTPKALYNVAQGQQSGEAAMRHPGLRYEQIESTLKALYISEIVARLQRACTFYPGNPGWRGCAADPGLRCRTALPSM